LATLGLAACSSSYEKRETAGTEASSVRLDPGKSILIAVSADGQYGSRAYLGTGRVVAQKAAAAFSRYARQVEISNIRPTERDALLVAARKAGSGYLILPTIAHWEQRATEWSGVPSRVSIDVAIVDVGTGTDLRSGLLESRSARMTLVRPNPDALAEHLLDDYVAGLYGAPIPASPQ
jgi:hypothetical protein